MNTCITEFWSYFQKNQYAFQMLKEIEPDKRSELLNELNRLINNFHPKIGFIFKMNNNAFEFIITAYGNPYIFKSVELLVKYAPTIEKWTFTPFIQPIANLDQYKTGTDKPFEYKGISLKISDMKFQTTLTENNPLLISIEVYITNLILHNYNDYLTSAVYIILEHLLGEKSFANEIHSVKITQLTLESDSTSTALYNLPTYVKIARGLSAEELSI